MLRFVFLFVFMFHFHQASDNLSFRTQCQSNWHYLSQQSLCVMFATSEIGDVPWYDGYKGCQSTSAQLLTLTQSNKLRSIENKIYDLEKIDQIDFDYIQRGSWIGKAKWSNDDLCDSMSTTKEDLEFNCMIITMRSGDQSLCLKRVSCTENHPFICESTALTAKELIENTIERLTWWKCVILIWCIIDDQVKKKKEKEALEAQKAEIQAYVSQFDFEIPPDSELPNIQLPLAAAGEEEEEAEPLVVGGYQVPSWLILTVGGMIFVGVICCCCLGLLAFIPNRYVQAINESCGGNKPLCDEPLKCIGGRCLCSPVGRARDKDQFTFWANEKCHPCPTGYYNTATKCFNLVYTKGSQLTWERARERCKEQDGDLLVFRSDEEYYSMEASIKSLSNDMEMPQRVPQDGTYFASIWLGIKLADWRGNGRFNLVADGPTLTKKNQHWCGQSSPLGHEPNYVQLKATGERQACVGLALFKDGSVCMHDWFCSWESYTLCEVHPPPLETSTDIPEALEKKSSGMMGYVVIITVVVLFLGCIIGATYYLFKKKKRRGRARSFDSGESGLSQNSLY
ncbi:unnamed protein product [Adineta ricciae]|uniref:C-type lectin domain-containing protein n=1 Tax=Adineta ricciae TaxID=249248 RepID=A0A814NH27_ADIRI|nr:unnamed protein product [Adineta ricciae]